MLDILLLVLVVFLSCVWVLEILKRPKNLPPGPWELPIVGSLLWLGRKPHKTIAKWSDIYGDVIYCNFGTMPMLILNSCEAMKEAFVKQANIFAGRPELYSFFKEKPELGEWQGGVVLNEGHSWQTQRRFTLSSLRDFGVGKSSLEGKVKEEIEVMLDAIQKTNGRAFDIGEMLEISITNVIFSIVFGNRYDYDDEEFRKIVQKMQRAIQIFGKNFIITFLPFLRHVPPFKGYLDEGLENRSTMMSYWKKSIDEHKETFDPGHVRDFIDAYLLELQSIDQSKDGTTALNETQLMHIIGDLFGAGSDTTNTTLKWGILYMAYYPEVQAKIQEELDAVVGRSRLPGMQDKVRLTYCDAACNEMLRMSSIVPLGLMHKTTQATTLYGHHIPEGITVTANLWAMHMDDRHWKNPEEFNPQRFIDADGKLLKPESFVPFSLGKRACLGEALAKMELYLFFVCLLHRFTFTFPSGVKKPDMEGILGVVLGPHKYQIIATPR